MGIAWTCLWNRRISCRYRWSDTGEWASRFFWFGPNRACPVPISSSEPYSVPHLCYILCRLSCHPIIQTMYRWKWKCPVVWPPHEPQRSGNPVTGNPILQPVKKTNFGWRTIEWWNVLAVHSKGISEINLLSSSRWFRVEAKLSSGGSSESLWCGHKCLLWPNLWTNSFQF